MPVGSICLGEILINNFKMNEFVFTASKHLMMRFGGILSMLPCQALLGSAFNISTLLEARIKLTCDD